jgi:hypothetical protein
VAKVPHRSGVLGQSEQRYTYSKASGWCQNALVANAERNRATYSLLDRPYRWQERVGQRWGNPVSLALDRFSRKHTILGPLLGALLFFVVEFLLFLALFGGLGAVLLAVLWAVTAILVFSWNVGYYRWLRPEQENVHRDPLP